MSSNYTVLVTGANSGLGFTVCCRLIDEFLATRPVTQSLHLIFTTRDKPKSDATLKRLRDNLRRTIRNVYGSETKTASIRDLQEQRIRLEGETMDLCLLPTVKRCAARLAARNLHLDSVVLNAGIGGWTGLNYFRATRSFASNFFEAVTFPNYKLGTSGSLCKAQLPKSGGTASTEPVLGDVFTANVFGHYMLVHWLAKALSATEKHPQAGRIVWVSSLEAQGHCYDPTDMQGLLTDASYESSKRLTDILALSSARKSTQRSVAAFLPATNASDRPKQYLAHPGVCLTSIAPVPAFILFFVSLAFTIARLIGSPWHLNGAYKGAVTATWLALASPSTLDTLEEQEGKAKWGSATTRAGEERVVRTYVDGWGWGGRPGETADKTWRLATKWWLRAVPAKKEEDVAKFEELGAQVWREMEELRVRWEEILKDV
ncbi:hypothetical protein ANO11243_059550 [Dothideomycetidae sp. 11243]|nr:hypothetical protein ANO11243_059550 [fungal sp. No.11243]